jgi:ATP synthase protein I
VTGSKWLRLPQMSEKPPDPLARLGERLDRARSDAQAGRRPAQKSGGNPGLQQGLALGFRIGVELVTAVVVSVAIGWGIDRWLGTKPWVMLAMFFLGVAAGMLNVYRAVTGTGGAVGYRPRTPEGSAAPPQKRNWDDDEDC